MKTSHLGAALVLSAAIVSLTAPAQADVKAVEHIHIDNPRINAMMQSMSPQQKKQMAALGVTNEMTSTIYLSGKRQRTDVGPVSVFSDEAHHKVVMINRMTKTQTDLPLDSQAMKHQVAGSTATVVDTGKTAVIMGHVAHLYKLSMTNAAQGVKTTGELWAAPDIPTPRSNPLSAQMGGVTSAEIAKIKGFPLKFSMKSDSPAMGPITITGAIKSLSLSPLPASTFTVPSGFHQGSPAFPGVGMGAPAP